MKTKWLIVCWLCLLVCNLHAQTILIANSLTKVPNSSAIVQYNNLFGQWNMPERDDSFPFAVIRVNLSGNESNVRAAKLKLGFDVGNMQRIESDVRTEPNQIIILVPKEVRNIYLTCGDGCEKKMLFSGRLESNAVYSCKIEYQSKETTSSQTNIDAQVLQELQALKQQLAQLQEENKAKEQDNVQKQNVQPSVYQQQGVNLNILANHATRLDCRDITMLSDTQSISDPKANQYVLECKIREYVRNSMIALRKENKVGDALRYMFGAQVLLSDLPDKNTFTLSVPTSDGTKKDVIATTYISQQIKNILEGVQITCDGFLPGSTTEAKLSFLYNGKAVTNLNYIYNDNTGWSEDNMPVKDGWTIVSLPAKNHPSTLHVKIEYRYADEAAFDPELQTKMMKYGKNYNYDDAAKHIVPMTEKTIAELSRGTSSAAAPSTGMKVSAAANTNLTQNIVADKVKQARHMVSKEDSTQYRQVIEKVCDAIASKNYQSAYTCFTEDGYSQFEKLVRYGNARIICRTDYRFVKLGQYVMCRSIPMSFTFTKGKQTIENVVFTFDENKKVDGIQFALEERSARNIMADTRYNETSQLTLINFMENYKTAFALKRLDYIESIFADEVFYWFGRLPQEGELLEHQLVVNNVIFTRQSKNEYIGQLDIAFKSKDWIDMKMTNLSTEISPQGEQYGVQFLQEYASKKIGNREYIFWLIDCEEEGKPRIRVCVWQPETAGSTPFSLYDYEALTALKY